MGVKLHMNIENFTSPVISALQDSGWKKDRDVWDKLVFTQEKDVFDEFKALAKSFGHLKIELIGKPGPECIYFDLDESDLGKDLRAKTFNYSNRLDEKWLVDPDFMETEDFEETSEIQKIIGKRCSRFGFWEEYLGMDLFISIDGEIYVSHYYSPTLFADSLVDFLNKVIVGYKNA